MFSGFDDFWKYYIGEIESQVPKELWNSFLEIQKETQKSKGKKPEKMTQEEIHASIVQNQVVKFIHNSLKKLTEKQVGELNYFIRSTVKFPKKIALVYTPEIDTYASWYNAPKKQFEILYPTITVFVKKFPDTLKAGILHELGHIINGDSLVKADKLHKLCSNIAMDARINMHLDYQMLDYLSRCLQFVNHPSYFVKPEEWYPSIGLPSTPGGYSWDFAHQQYHFFDNLDPKNPKFPQPKSGQQQLTPEEAEEIMGTFNPDEIQEGEPQDGDEGDQEGSGGEGQEKEGKKPGDKKEGKGEGGEEKEGKNGKEKGKGKPGEEEGETGEGGGGEKEGEGKEGKEKKHGEGEEGKGEKEGEDGKEKEGKADGEGKKQKPGGDIKDPTKNSRQNKGLMKNIDKTIGVLNKIKEKYA